MRWCRSVEESLTQLHALNCPSQAAALKATHPALHHCSHPPQTSQPMTLCRGEIAVLCMAAVLAMAAVFSHPPRGGRRCAGAAQTARRCHRPAAHDPPAGTPAFAANALVRPHRRWPSKPWRASGCSATTAAASGWCNWARRRVSHPRRDPFDDHPPGPWRLGLVRRRGLGMGPVAAWAHPPAAPARGQHRDARCIARQEVVYETSAVQRRRVGV